MEIALHPAMPTYSGGLGILAGDTVRSAADLGVPFCGVTLLHRKGYFVQRIDNTGWQQESPESWDPSAFLQELPERVAIYIEGRRVAIRTWLFEIAGAAGAKVPVYLLDTDLAENTPFDRTLTDFLYGGDSHYRLCQEVVLGVGGVRILQALGHDRLVKYHMNEGHAALLGVELLNQEAKKAGRARILREDVLEVRAKCVFTTHTPVPAGHDRFPMDMVANVLGHQKNFLDMQDLFCPEDIGRVFDFPPQGFDRETILSATNHLNMTYLALNLSHYVNGVAKRHAEVSRLMFADVQIDAITNGIHVPTWVAPPLQALYDKRMSGWRADNFVLRNALIIPPEEIWAAHLEAKQKLITHINATTAPKRPFDTETCTIGFARRATSYKRPDLLFADLERLKAIGIVAGGLQIVYGGKAHPQDYEGKLVIQRILRAADALGNHVRVVYLENYGMELAKLLLSGVDLWLNTPLPPLEASGTSGMKAAVNGVPSLSVLDGWWLEGCIEGITGWAIDTLPADEPIEKRSQADAQALLEKLTQVALLFRNNRDKYVTIMQNAIALNGSHFNTQRMMQQYVSRAYFD